MNGNHATARETIMSAPRTNIEKQKRHHMIPIIGIVLVVLIALAGFL